MSKNNYLSRHNCKKPAVVAKWSETPVFSNSSRESLPFRFQVPILLRAWYRLFSKELLQRALWQKGLQRHFVNLPNNW